jgi:hypothetical protein
MVVSPRIDLTTYSNNDLFLEFTYWINAELWSDGASVIYSNDGMNTWYSLGDPSNYNWYNYWWVVSLGWMMGAVWSEYDNTWRTVSYRISSYTHRGSRDFYIAFAYGSNEQLRSDGFAFDNVTIDISKSTL